MNPVLYYSEEQRELINRVYRVRLSCDDHEITALLEQLSSLFQCYSYREQQELYPNYYQREWRLALTREKAVHSRINDHYAPGEISIRTGSHTTSYFYFDEKDIEGVIVPRNWLDQGRKLLDLVGLDAELAAYEDLVGQ